MARELNSECPPSYWGKTPSRLDGITASTELELRQKICRFILTMIRCLKINDNYTEINAFMFVQSFYNRHSFVSSPVDKYDLGLAALFLSLKLNNHLRTMHELVLNQWSYLSPKVPVPSSCTKRMKDRMQCIAKAELILISTVNFRVQYETQAECSDEMIKMVTFGLTEGETNHLLRHYYFLTYHSFWTHVGLFYDPLTVCFACVKIALEELSLEKQTANIKWGEFEHNPVETEHLRDVCEALKFGKFHIPGELSQHDKIKPVDMSKFSYESFQSAKPNGYKRLSQVEEPFVSRGKETVQTIPELSGNMVITIYSIPERIKHREALEKTFEKEIPWAEFSLRKDGTNDVSFLFRSKTCIQKMFVRGLFLHFHRGEFDVCFGEEVCQGYMVDKFSRETNEDHDDRSFSLYVANIPETTSEEELLQLFKDKGEISSVKIPFTHNKRARHYAFVNFKREEDLKGVLNQKISLRNYILDVSPCVKDESVTAKMENGVQIDNFPCERLTERELLREFGSFGELKSLCILKDRRNALSIKGVAFVFYSTKEGQRRAIKNSGKVVEKWRVKVRRLGFNVETIARCSVLFPVAISAIPKTANYLELKRVLGQCGVMSESKLIYKLDNTGHLNGYGYYLKEESQKMATEMRNLLIKGKHIKVTLFSPKLVEKIFPQIESEENKKGIRTEECHLKKRVRNDTIET